MDQGKNKEELDIINLRITQKPKKKPYFIGHHKEWSMILTDIISRPLAVLIARYTSISPNQISLISFSFILIAASFLLQGGSKNILIGAIFAFLYNTFDLVDGMVARERKQTSVIGHWLDAMFGFVSFPILIITLTIGMRNYLAFILGILAIISYPTQYLVVHFYNSEIAKEKEPMKISGKLESIRYAYGSSFFYVFLLIAAIVGKPLYVLIFWATLGNLYWIMMIFTQYLNLKKGQQ